MLHYGVPAWKIRVIAEGCDHLAMVQSDRSVFDRLGIRPNGYVLAVSSLNPNKNFGLVVRAIELLASANVQFVIAGGADPKVFAGHAGTMPEYAKHIGYVTDQELKALYEGAICLVYPSLYEGFGLPPLEAMACGCPVIVSREASLPEVCGDAAWYCDTHDPRDLAAQIVRLSSSAESRRSLRDRGLIRASRYSWRRCAVEHLEQLDEVIQHASAWSR
jgi:glycosyltransferase involved in cell wall biosynthesis